MRKLVWCGAAVMVAGAAAVYVAAKHAADHPDSYWGRCAAAAAHLGARCNPFIAVNELMRDSGITKAAEFVGDAVVGRGEDCDEEAAECAGIHKPEGAAEAEENVAVEELAVAVEAVQEAEVVEPKVQGLDEFEPREGFVAGSSLPAPEAVMPPETEEPRTGTTEESEPAVTDPLIPPPTSEEQPADNEVPEGNEDKAAGSEGKCWLWDLLKATGLIEDTTPAADVEILEMPNECGDDEPQDEGVEEVPCEETQATPEPYDYHRYHHDSCPYMGCPYPYSHCPSQVTPVPQSSKKDRVKKKAQRRQARKPADVEAMWQKLHGANATEDGSSVHTGVDTMEFRPSDDHRTPPGRDPF